MSNVVNRVTKQYLTSVNTPDFPSSQWIVNPDLSAVGGFPSRYWILTGDVVTLMSQAQRDAVDDQLFTDGMAAIGPTQDHIFGDGADGDVTVAGNTTLNRDVYPSILTVDPGVILNTNGYRIIARRGIINRGTIRNNGANGNAENGGLGGISSTLGGGGAGATGVLSVGVNAADLNTNPAPGYGGAGGNGGSSAGGSVPGGDGGSVFANGTARVRPRRLDALLLGGDFDFSVAGFIARFQGGAGGGSGGGLAALLGAGGGGGGGIVFLIGPLLFNATTGVVEARGGNGSNSPGGNGGGGGGGGGGIIAAVRRVALNRGTITVAGGSGGNGTGTGANGAPGADGRIITFDVS